jgi:hypothetical protein
MVIVDPQLFSTGRDRILPAGPLFNHNEVAMATQKKVSNGRKRRPKPYSNEDPFIQLWLKRKRRRKKDHMVVLGSKHTFTPAEVAEVFRLTRATICSWCRNGLLQATGIFFHPMTRNDDTSRTHHPGVCYTFDRGCRMILAYTDIFDDKLKTRRVKAEITTDHPASSYGKPVVVVESGGTLDLFSWTAFAYRVVRASKKELMALRGLELI